VVHAIVAAIRLRKRPTFSKYSKLPAFFQAYELNQMLDELRERILKHEDEMASLGHTMNERMHTELKSAFDQGGYQDSTQYMKNLQEKLKSGDEHITLLQSTLTETETRLKAKIECLKKEAGLKDLQIEALSKAVKRSSP
jgi:hypothetical protein